MSTRTPSLGAVVLAAGRSKRFKGAQPKVLHPLCGRPLVVYVLEALRELHRSHRLKAVSVVVPPGKEVEKTLAAFKFPFPIAFAVQKDAGGTGAATQIGLRKLADVDDVLVLAGDAPLVQPESLAALIRERRGANAAGALLTAVLPDGGPYGRILRSGGRITGIVEEKDATPEQQSIKEINTCILVYTKEALSFALPKLKADNVQKERYLTDVVGVLIEDGRELTSVEGSPTDILGTNTRSEYATIARLLRERIVDDLMTSGVTILDPDTTYVDAGVKVGPDTVIYPNTYLEGSTKIGTGCEIGPSTRLVDTTVGDEARVTFAVARESKIGRQASVGPFAHLRAGTVIGKGAEVGSFAEMKNTRFGDGAKAHHFSYLGDATIGDRTNIGAGTITCNYDGKDKHATTIGDDAFIGSDSVLVAPVRVGRGAYTGAGSVVTRNVPAGGLVYGVPATKKTRTEKPTKKPTKKGAKKR